MHVERRFGRPAQQAAQLVGHELVPRPLDERRVAEAAVRMEARAEQRRTRGVRRTAQQGQ